MCESGKPLSTPNHRGVGGEVDCLITCATSLCLIIIMAIIILVLIKMMKRTLDEVGVREWKGWRRRLSHAWETGPYWTHMTHTKGTVIPSHGATGDDGWLNKATCTNIGDRFFSRKKFVKRVFDLKIGSAKFGQRNWKENWKKFTNLSRKQRMKIFWNFLILLWIFLEFWTHFLIKCLGRKIFSTVFFKLICICDVYASGFITIHGASIGPWMHVCVIRGECTMSILITVIIHLISSEWKGCIHPFIHQASRPPCTLSL